MDRSTPARAADRGRLDFLVDYYQKQVDQHRWYGFWDYGDVMHTYDPDRHVWRYDVGGYAWDNSELSPDLWLWYSYLRSGRCRRLPVRRGDDPAHRRGGRLPPRAVPRSAPGRRPALGGQRETGAHQHCGVPPLFYFLTGGRAQAT